MRRGRTSEPGPRPAEEACGRGPARGAGGPRKGLRRPPASRGMRVLLANPYFLPFEGGIEARMAGLARGLAARHEVAVLTCRLPGTAAEERRDGYAVLRVPATVWRSFPYNPPPAFARGVLDAVAAWGPDVADFQYRWAPEWTAAMRRWARRAPAVFTWHNPFGEGTGPTGALSRWHDARFLGALRDVRRVITISQAVARDLGERGVPREKLVPIHAGFDAPPALPATDGGYALFVGRLVDTKGLDVLLDALPRAPDVRLVVVGKGPRLGFLQRRARDRGVADRVRFAGFVSAEEKERLMAGARLVAHPARWEGLGHALAEAMLHGKPVVATDVGGIPEVVGPGGVLVPPEDPRALADALRGLWADAGLREALGAKARAHAATFTWERCVALTERAYREAAAG